MPFAWATNAQRIEVAVQILGILNVTEDSFSDGGRFDAPERALQSVQVWQACNGATHND